MSLSDQTIQELQQILKEDYGREIPSAEASEIAHSLVGYFDLLAKIYHLEAKNYDDDKSTTRN